jgi:hypothetical protein
VPVRAHRGTVGRQPPGARAPAKGRRGLDYTHAGCVGWVLGKVPEWLGGFGGGHQNMSRDGSLGKTEAEPGAGCGVLAQG